MQRSERVPSGMAPWEDSPVPAVGVLKTEITVKSPICIEVNVHDLCRLPNLQFTPPDLKLGAKTEMLSALRSVHYLLACSNAAVLGGYFSQSTIHMNPTCSQK